jgi:Right handed beta helix region
MQRSVSRRRRLNIGIAVLIAVAIGVVEFGRDDRRPLDLLPARPSGAMPENSPAPELVPVLGVASNIRQPLPGSNGATFHVSRAGSDENPGTAEEPWATIQHAMDTLQPGERVLVAAGTYVEDLVMSRGGTPDAQITIAAEDAGSAILRPASGTGDTYPVRFADEAGYVRLEGFVIEGADGTSSTNVYFEDEVHDIELVGNEIRFSQDQGVFSERTTSDLSIVGNRIHDNGRGHEPGQHQSHGLYIEGERHLIANNAIYDHPHGFGIQIYPANQDSSVVNNTIVRSGHSGIVLGGSDGVEGLVVRNNIVAFNESYGIAMDDSCPTDSVVDTNLVRGNGEGTVDGSCGDGVDTSRGNLGGDPRFADPGRNYLRLLKGSAALDRARATWSPATDIRGRRRPWGADVDIGAYEGIG